MSSKSDEQPLRWGILGAGLISGDFVRAMCSCSHNNQICGVAASSDVKRAEAFSDQHFKAGESRNRVQCYGSYAELLARDDIDVVYVGVSNHLHKEVVIQALNAKKPVLCEKPLAVNAKEVKEMMAAADRNGVFLMEAYWSRFFPVWTEIREKTAAEVGDVYAALCDFGINVERVQRTPKEQGGGYLLANGCYAVMFAIFAFGDERPEKVVATGELCPKKGIDLHANITLKYSGGRVANVWYSGIHETPCQASISGSKGHLKLPQCFWSPSKLIVEPKGGDPQTRNFPLPSTEWDYTYPNSVGLCYEADHVFECLQSGKKESPIMPLKTSLLLAEVFDEIRKQLGMSFPQDL